MTLLSIITVVYNDCSGLKRTISAIDSAVDRSTSASVIEHIIVDGASNDGTAQFLEAFKDCRSIKTVVVSEPDHGIYDAMNKGICYSNGQVVVFLNAGDELDTRCDIDTLLQDVEMSLARVDEAGFVYSTIMKIGIKEFEIKPRAVDPRKPRMPGVHQSMFYKRSTLISVPFDISFKICGDYDNFARIMGAIGCFRPIYRYFAVFYAGGISSTKPLLLIQESYQISTTRFVLTPLDKLKVIVRLLLSLICLQLILLFERATGRA